MKIYSNEDLRREFSISFGAPYDEDWFKTYDGLMNKGVLLTQDEHDHITEQFLRDWFDNFVIDGVVYEFDHFEFEETNGLGDETEYLYDICLKPMQPN